MAAGTRGARVFARKACRIFDFKPSTNLLKVPASTTQVLRQNGSFAIVTLSPNTRQLLNTVRKNSKWNKSVFDCINRSASSAMVCLLTTGASPLITGLCSSSDELSVDGDEDSTNRKKRIYLFELVNNDP